jgi:hypothetical protein
MVYLEAPRLRDSDAALENKALISVMLAGVFVGPFTPD